MNDTYGCTRGNFLSGRENLPRRGKSTWKDPVICRTLMASFLRPEREGTRSASQDKPCETGRNHTTQGLVDQVRDFSLYPMTSRKLVKTFATSSCDKLVYRPCCCNNNKTLMHWFR